MEGQAAQHGPPPQSVNVEVPNTRETVMEERVTRPGGFDVLAFFTAIDERRRQEALGWAALAAVVWEQSRVLNDQRRGDHPLSPATLRNMGTSGGSCQHALFALRWLDCPPETFVVQPRPGTTGVSLPATDAAHRLRWNLLHLYTALNTARTERAENWQQVAERLHCTSSQLTGLRTAKFATGMRLAMWITQALRRPAADFIEPASW
jgi:hypothetical protein